MSQGSTFGPAYDRQKDEPALTDQRERIKNLMSDGAWRPLCEIHRLTGYPEASISAQLRHLRKIEFGGWRVDKRRPEGSRLWEYRISLPTPEGQYLMFNLSGMQAH